MTWRTEYDRKMEIAMAAMADAITAAYREMGLSTPEFFKGAGRLILEAQNLRMEATREELLSDLQVGASAYIAGRNYKRVDEYTVIATKPSVTLEIPYRGQP